MMTASDELFEMVVERLHDPGKFVERGKNGNKQEPLKMHQARAVMTAFEEVVKREKGGKVTVLGRTAFRDPNPEYDDE